MKKLIFIAVTGVIFLILTGCPTERKVIIGNYSFKTECLGIGGDGSQTVKAWGNGRNKIIAIEQAKKNAVRDVLFKGILDGKADCDPKPVVPEVNAQVNNERYFTRFFADNGDYKKYVWLVEERPNEAVFPDKVTVTFSVILKIQRYELKQKMIEDGILK